MGGKPKRKPRYKIEKIDRVLTYIGVSTMFFDEILKKLETLSDKSLVILYKYSTKTEFNNYLYWEDLGYWSAKELESRGIFTNRQWKFNFDSDEHLSLPPQNDSS